LREDADPAAQPFEHIQAATTDSKRKFARCFVVRLSKSPKEELLGNSFYEYADPEKLGQQAGHCILVFFGRIIARPLLGTCAYFKSICLTHRRCPSHYSGEIPPVTACSPSERLVVHRRRSYRRQPPMLRLSTAGKIRMGVRWSSRNLPISTLMEEGYSMTLCLRKAPRRGPIHKEHLEWPVVSDWPSSHLKCQHSNCRVNDKAAGLTVILPQVWAEQSPIMKV
ncbi:hypothetical protein M441DRAFT_58833, partial [Trichoderma asperellum CBS 433.97]